MWWRLLGLSAVAMGVLAKEGTFENGRSAEDRQQKVRNPFQSPPYGDVYGDIVPDRVEVVSTALRILPKRTNSEKGKSLSVNVGQADPKIVPNSEITRQRRATAAESTGWRKPRQYEFVTRRDWLNGADGRWVNGEGRSARLLDEPESSASRYYADERLPYDGYYNRRSGHAPQKQRIIYYATLPEIVRRPGEWTPPRPIYGGYPNNHPRENEVAPPPPRSPPIDDHFYSNDGGTRVSSSIIGFSDKHDVKPYPASAPIDDLSTPKFTIIDAEPPYSYRGPPPPDRYDLRYDNRYDQDKYDFDRFDQRYNSHRNYGSPYGGGGDRPFYGGPVDGDRRAGPPRSPEVPLPPLPLTIVRKPLDVRPLDPSDSSRRFTTQGPPVSSPTSTAAPTSTTSTTTGTILASFERSYNKF